MLSLQKLIAFFEHSFTRFNQTKYFAFCAGILVCSWLSYYLLLALKRRGGERLPVFVKRYLVLHSLKSSSNALQIGGIPFAFWCIVSLLGIFRFFPYLASAAQTEILFHSMIAWVGILGYGYLDDRYEIRPVVKLAFQFTLIAVFALGCANLLHPANSAFALVFMAFLGLALVNGANLIDGIDTLSYKVAAVTYLAFVVLAAPIQNLVALFIASAAFFALTGFYYFNRYPSRVHLGEIGGSCIGLSYFILATVTYEGYRHHNPVFSALAKALLPCVMPVLELAISFLRRLLNGKSPFKGDRLHLHHILSDGLGFTVSRAASLEALVLFVSLGFAFFLADQTNAVVALAVHVLVLLAFYLGVGWRYWFLGRITVNFFQGLMVKKEVKLIASDGLGDFEISINKKNRR